LDYNVPAMVTMKIVQPNSFEVEPIQTITISAQELMHWVQYVLLPAAIAASKPNAELVPGDQCKWCAAQAVCPAFADKATELASADFREVTRPALPPAAALTRKQVANVLKWAPLLDSWLREVESRAFEELQRGEEYPGFKLVRKKTNRAWPTEDADKLKKLLIGAGMPAKTNIFKEPEVLSPAQLEKLIKDKGIVAMVAQKPEGGLTMASSSDPREAITVGGDFKELE
jgi:hypothetical protein